MSVIIPTAVKDALKQTGIWGGETSKVFDTIKSISGQRLKILVLQLVNFSKGSSAEGGNTAKIYNKRNRDSN